MEIIPAIDLRGGHCVRLRQGDFAVETIFDNDPVAVASRFVENGADRIHVVDLDGAKDGVRVNARSVSSIVRGINVPVQVGGGIRHRDTATALLEQGVDRVIFGTAAIEAPDEVAHTVAAYGSGRVVVSVDSKGGEVTTHGWRYAANTSVRMLIKAVSELGVRRFIYTDVVKDGTLEHPDFETIDRLVKDVRHPILIAGGVASIDDLIRLKGIGIEGAIVGLAVHSGVINLCDAIHSVEAITLPTNYRDKIEPEKNLT